MSKFTVTIQHRPLLGPELVISMDAMDALLRAQPVIWKHIKFNDRTYYIPTWKDWRKIIDDLKPRVPKWVAERADCEFTAAWFYVHTCEDFNVNTMAQVQGWADAGSGVMGRHAWNVFTDGDYFYQLEPQTGVIMDMDDPLYRPDEIIIG